MPNFRYATSNPEKLQSRSHEVKKEEKKESHKNLKATYYQWKEYYVIYYVIYVPFMCNLQK